MNFRYFLPVAGFVFALVNVVLDGAQFIPDGYGVFGHWANLLMFGCLAFAYVRACARADKANEACRPPAVERNRLRAAQESGVMYPRVFDAHSYGA